MAEPAVLEFRAMGSPCRIVVDPGADDLAVAAKNLVLRLESMWSRFLETSEVSTLNRAGGNITVVSELTYRLIGSAVRANEVTGGVFNPLMLRQLEDQGYRNPWGEPQPEPSWQPICPPSEEPIVLYPEIRGVRLPQGSSFDPGGIGKGLAVDIAITHCLDEGSEMASVELGGDLRVYGTPWYGSQWTIDAADPFDPSGSIASFTPTSGAVTTSTIKKRNWTAHGRQYHHLLDPRTGQPSDTDIVAVTTCSSEAWWAEVAAKVALISGSKHAAAQLERLNTPGAIVTNTGQVIITNPRTMQPRAEACT